MPHRQQPSLRTARGRGLPALRAGPAGREQRRILRRTEGERRIAPGVVPDNEQHMGLQHNGQVVQICRRTDKTTREIGWHELKPAAKHRSASGRMSAGRSDGTAEGDRQMDKTIRRNNIRHTRRTDKAMPMGREHPEGRHALSAHTSSRRADAHHTAGHERHKVGKNV